MTTGDVLESPSALLARFRRSIDRQDGIVFAIDAGKLPGSLPAEKIGHIRQWVLALLDEETLRSSPSFGLFINRRLMPWFSGESCVCLYMTVGESDLAPGGLQGRIERHPGFVAAEATEWEDPYVHLLAYYDRRQRALHRAAPPVAVFLPSGANLDGADDGEWILVGIRDSADGALLEDYTSSRQARGREVDSRKYIDYYYGALYTPLLLRLPPLLRVRLGHIHDLPEVGSHYTWTILTQARDLDDVQRLLDDLYLRAEGVQELTEAARIRRRIAQDPAWLRRLLTDAAMRAEEHMEMHRVRQVRLFEPDPDPERISLQAHRASGCVATVFADAQGRVAAFRFLTDAGHSLIADAPDLTAWILAQCWEPLVPLIGVSTL